MTDLASGRPPCLDWFDFKGVFQNHSICKNQNEFSFICDASFTSIKPLVSCQIFKLHSLRIIFAWNPIYFEKGEFLFNIAVQNLQFFVYLNPITVFSVMKRQISDSGESLIVSLILQKWSISLAKVFQGKFCTILTIFFTM